MRKIVYLFIGLFCVTGCSARKGSVNNRAAHKNNRSIQKERGAAAAADFKPQTSLQYIERYKDIAIQEMNQYGIPASITLAQGLFESGSGNGTLARIANNHFGIKTSPTWTGKVYYKDDDNANDAFRVYDKPEDSFRDHSLFLQKKNYTHLFELDKNDYKGWAYGLKKGGYATNPKYPEMLINIIEKYNLDQYDSPDNEVAKIKRVDRVFTTIDKKEDKAAKDSIQNLPVTTKTYIIQPGDTLYNISKRFGIAVDSLKSINNIAGDTVKVGQKIVVTR